jgi:hypothetical protein
MRRIFLAYVVIVISCHTINAQNEKPVINFDWWRELVEWDGVTHWSQYYTFSPGRMGPNALPVPELLNGRIDNRNFVGLGGQAHFSKGDNTQNFTLYFNYNLMEDVVSIRVFLVPIEIFQMSHAVKEERKVYFEYYDVNHAVGDFYVDTNIQLLREDKSPLDAALRIGIKTASSGLLNPARFTDSPGYYFDVSFGRTLFESNGIEMKAYGMGGFYCWQTNVPGRPQNDALMYGLGYDIKIGSYTLSNHLTGFHGWHENGDSPLVARLNLEKRFNKTFAQLNCQKGFRDFRYKSIEAKIGYLF